MNRNFYKTESSRVVHYDNVNNIADKAGFRLCLLLSCLLFLSANVSAQHDSVSVKYNPCRLGFVTGSMSALYLGAFAGSYQFWYKEYHNSGFHFFNDMNEWQQQDKLGHATESYHIGRVGYQMLRWTGIKEKNAIWYGGVLGTVYLLNIEILDGFSSGWGFSLGDLGADMLGSAAFIGQQLAWDEQRFLIKISYHNTAYANYRPRLLGSTAAQRFMKDYNGQTYWLSASPGTFMKNNSFPKWLCFSLGYGADGMTGGSNNPAVAEDGTMIPAFDRYRKFYFSMDVDMSKIPTRCRFLKTVFSTVNFLKLPMPTLEYSNKRGFRGHWLYF